METPTRPQVAAGLKKPRGGRIGSDRFAAPTQRHSDAEIYFLQSKE
jgi:hypothetical protein